MSKDTRPLSERISPGPYKVHNTYQGMLTDKWRGMPHKVSSPTFDICLMFGDGTNNRGATAANTELIAEAFNVTHETGLTPRELARDREDLIVALRSLLFDSPSDGGMNTSDNITDAVSLYHRLTKP